MLRLEPSPDVLGLLALHWTLPPLTEPVLRDARRGLRKLAPEIVEDSVGAGWQLASTKPVAELLCVPRPDLVPVPRVVRPEFEPERHLKYWHFRMYAIANPDAASSSAAIEEGGKEVFEHGPSSRERGFGVEPGREAVVYISPGDHFAQTESDLLVGREFTVAVGDDFRAMEPLQRTDLLDALLYAAAQKALLESLADQNGRRAARPYSFGEARELSRRTNRYRLAFGGGGPGRPDLDRVVTTYRDHHDLDAAERELPDWAGAGQAVVSRAGASQGASGALLALPTATAAFANKAAGLQGTEVVLSVGLALAVLVVILVSPLGRTLIRELPEMLGVTPHIGLAAVRRQHALVVVASGAFMLLAVILSWLVWTDRVSLRAIATYGWLILGPMIALYLAWHGMRKNPLPPR